MAMNILLDWPTIVSRTLLHEGGYVWDGKDTGGETNLGISKRAYPALDIKNLTKDQAIAIYERDYWPGINQLCGPLAFQVFDAAVNCGKSRAVQHLQFVAGVPVDGVLGARTCAALSGMSYAAQVFGFIARQQQFYLDNPQFPVYGKGWIERWVENIQYAAQDFR